MNGEMDWSDIWLSIVLQHIIPFNASMLKIYFCLHIKHSCYTSRSHSFDIIFYLRIWADENARVINFVKWKTSYKISICLVDASVDNIHIFYVRPSWWSLISKLTRICVRILDSHISGGFSLPYSVVLFCVKYWILVCDDLFEIWLSLPNWVLPWHDFSPSKPSNFFSLYHLNWTTWLLIPVA